MKQQTAIFRGARPQPPHWEVTFDVAHPPAAGAFVLADLGGPLRTALFPAALHTEGFAALVAPGHPATRLLPGAEVDMLGPLGHGFEVGRVERLLLVAEPSGLPLLLPLLTAAPSVALIVAAATRAQLPSPARIPPAVELVLVTRDGSAGLLGPLESAAPAPPHLQRALPRFLELTAWAERICLACGPERYPALAALVHGARLQPQPGFAQAFVPAEMPCGVGACEVCRVATRQGEVRVCVEGPVLDLLAFEGCEAAHD